MSNEQFVCYRCQGEGYIDSILLEGFAEECPICEGEGYTKIKLDKKPRWRAIIKSGEKICPRLMDKYYWSENVQMQWASGGMGVKEELRVLETLHSYGNIIYRTAKTDMYEHPKEWVRELTNFTD